MKVPPVAAAVSAVIGIEFTRRGDGGQLSPIAGPLDLELVEKASEVYPKA